MERRWISPREAADYLSLHSKTIYRLIAQGKIPGAKVGGAVRVDLKRLEALLLEMNCQDKK